MTTVVMFPGQGSQEDGMRALVDRYVPHLAELASEEAGADVFERVDESTRYAQPALYCAAMAGWRAMVETGALDGAADDGLVFTGHSLGEVAAVVAAGALDAEAGLRVVVRRGAAMDDAARGSGRGSAVAILGPGAREFAEAHCGRWVALANDNSPVQVVVSGRKRALTRFAGAAAEAGYRVRSLPLDFAAHSHLMGEAAERFEDMVGEFDFRQPKAPVWSCSTVRPFEDIPRQLARAIAEPVRWRELVHRLHDEGARTFVEPGPGRVLAKLVRKTLDDVEVRDPSNLIPDRLERAHATAD